MIRQLKAKDFRAAFKSAMDGVAYCETHRSPFGIHRLYWWIFMESAARSANELGDDERNWVIARMATAPEPGGLNESICLEWFSRWRWASRDEDGAIDFARRAVLADPARPDGHIVLAWYGLRTGRFDPLPSLRDAVRQSPEAISRIRANADFAAFPELLAALNDR